jgi:hypothetical protein
MATRLGMKALISGLTSYCTNITSTRGSLYKRLLVETGIVQGTNPLSITFRPRDTLATTDSYTIAYSISYELSQAQLSFSIYGKTRK